MAAPRGMGGVPGERLPPEPLESERVQSVRTGGASRRRQKAAVSVLIVAILLAVAIVLVAVV